MPIVPESDKFFGVVRVTSTSRQPGTSSAAAPSNLPTELPSDERNSVFRCGRLMLFARSISMPSPGRKKAIEHRELRKNGVPGANGGV